MTAIHQLVAGYANGDAISNEARMLRTVFRSWGCNAEIFCDPAATTPALRRDALPPGILNDGLQPNDIVLLHLSMGCDANLLFKKLPCRKVIIYHNITPAHYFKAVNPATAHRLELGRSHLKALAGCAEINLADSRFNAAEMSSAGYSNVSVFPLMLDMSAIRTAPDRRMLGRLAGSRHILFVGRCAPNKRIEDLVSLTMWLRTAVDPAIRLLHAGSWAGTESYYSLVRAKARETGVDTALFTGSVTQAQLSACFHSAELFVCMSEHEGFCIPVLESMMQDVPVMAYAAGAVPETMDGAGVLFHKKDFAAVAEMAAEIMTNNKLRDSLLAKQRARVERYFNRNLAAELQMLLAPLLNNAGIHISATHNQR